MVGHIKTITEYMEARLYGIGVYLDLKKAFDM